MTGRSIGPTFDETTYVEEGLRHFRTGSRAGLVKLGTMPLPVDAATLPLSLVERATGVRFDARADLPVLLPLARNANLVFWALLLASAMRLARRLGGPWAGRLAVVFLATEPTVLAHASLATTDVAISATLTGLLDAFLAARGERWPRRVVVPGLWAGAALLSKASALVFAPLALLAAEGVRLGRTGALPQGPLRERWRGLATALRPFRRDLALASAVALLVALVYTGSDFRPQKSFVAWAGTVDGAAGPPLRAVASSLRVFPNALEAVTRQLKHNAIGHGVYLLGASHRRAVPWYFPVALTMELGPALVVLPLLLLLLAPRALANEAAAAAGALLSFSALYRVQIGVRLVLPLVALLAVGTAVALAAALGTAPRGRRLLLAAAVAAGVAAGTAGVLGSLPDPLRYTSPLWGGSSRGPFLLSDSNHDWGQGLPELRRLVEARGLAPLDVWYFGTDPAIERPPFRKLALGPAEVRDLPDLLGRVEGNVLAVSATLLHGAYTGSPPPGWLLELRRLAPLARTDTFFLLDVGVLRTGTPPR